MGKIEKICEFCNKPYLVNISQINRSKFCSNECFRKSRKTVQSYRCDNCGTLFDIPLRKLLNKQNGKRKHICCSKECFDNIQKPKFEDIQKLFKERGYVLLSKEYISAKIKLDYICPKHEKEGIQSITYNNLKNGCGCKYCGHERTATSKRNDFQKVYDAFDKKGLILQEQEYVNSQQLLKYICPIHENVGIQFMSYANVCSNGCPHCSQSKGEIKISNWLYENQVEYVSQQKYENLTGVGGGLLSYDFLIPNINLLIEYQGNYHDGTAGNQTEEDFIVQKEHDRRKKQYAIDNNIKLLEIWYWDFNEIESILEKEIL